MILRAHFIELQHRLFFSIATWLTTFVVSYAYRETITFFLLQHNLSNICEKNHYFITNKLAEIFSVHVNVSIFVANQISWLLLFYTMLSFLSPGLYKHEITKVTSILKTIVLTWLILTTVFYVVLVPFAWKFFLNLNTNDVSIFFEARLMDYLESFLQIYFFVNLVGIALISLLYHVDGEVTKIKKLRKFFFFFSFSLAAVFTPPDILSQIFVASIFMVVIETYVVVSVFKTSRVVQHNK